MSTEDDAPPTASLRDPSASTLTPVSSHASHLPPSTHTPPQGSSSSASHYPSLPPPPGLIPLPTTTTLHIFGPPSHILAQLRPFFEEIGEVIRYSPGPQGSNWFDVEFSNPTSALYALRRHGEILRDGSMLGVKVAGPGSTSGFVGGSGAGPANRLLNGGNGNGNGNGSGRGSGQQNGWAAGDRGASAGGEMIPRPGPGTPLRVQQTSVMKGKPAAAAMKSGMNGETYAWDEAEAPSGLMNKAAEWLVSWPIYCLFPPSTPLPLSPPSSLLRLCE